MIPFRKTSLSFPVRCGVASSRLLAAGMVAAIVCLAVLGAGAAAEQSETRAGASWDSLPPTSALPSGFTSAGTLANRGSFYTADGRLSFRQDDGDAHHGSDSLPVWALTTRDEPTQGALYGVEGGKVVSAGYLVRQADLVGGKSFRHLSLRGLDFPAPQHLTVDFIEDGQATAGQYLFLWHFVALEGPPSQTLPTGALPSVTSLPPKFSLYACDQYPNAFCPRMGRHHRDLSKPLMRTPTATGDDGVTYGEASGRLIFIEYVFPQQELAAGTSWATIPLNGLPIPPIDNLHLLHYNGTDGAPGRYTAHMYFVPESTYLGWDAEPPTL